MYFQEKLVYIVMILFIGIISIIFFLNSYFLLGFISLIILTVYGIYYRIKDTLMKEKRIKENHDNLEKIANNTK